jgi:hypothetical protein
LINDPAKCHRDEHVPELITILHIRELTAGRAIAQATKDAQGHVFLIGHSAWRMVQMLPGEPHQLVEISLPKQASGLVVTCFQGTNPVGRSLVILLP